MQNKKMTISKLILCNILISDRAINVLKIKFINKLDRYLKKNKYTQLRSLTFAQLTSDISEKYIFKSKICFINFLRLSHLIKCNYFFQT